MNYQYTLDYRQIEIVLPKTDEGHYRIIWENRAVGYVYVSDVDAGTGKPIWNGSNNYLNLSAPEIGLYIEACGM
ncbi:hypothetical protein SAMN06265348_110281 [Pedobacter westerhofensis]|uniref:Uncharacterized protein n=1 Tax=Pedobacter westerhofensis TaxID=425512 RepID=A0A521F828_9SPHI|nr:hypothetical protein SAMN06265348_110281 [Pedobacter westerhofensis]